MNNCVLMAEIVEAPQLRYTSDNQTPMAQMTLEFPGFRPEDPPARMNAVGWGNLALEIQERYKQGDQVVVEGRLGMNTIDRPEGFKEKRAEITIQRIHALGGASLTTSVTSATTSATPEPRAAAPSRPPATVAEPKANSRNSSYSKAVATPKVTTPQYEDDIPF